MWFDPPLTGQIRTLILLHEKIKHQPFGLASLDLPALALDGS